MSSLAYLLAALALSLLGVATVMLRHRERSGMDHTVQTFQKEMRALDPNKRQRGLGTVEPDNPAGRAVVPQQVTDTEQTRG